MAPQIFVEHQVADDRDARGRKGVQSARKIWQLAHLAADQNLAAGMSTADESVFHDSAENMNYQGVSFLNSWRGAGRHDDRYIDEVA
jgi:hypothetical protein